MDPLHDAPDATCSRCGCFVDAEDLSVEAFELCGDLVCEGCAEEVFEENGQFGVGS
jgi:hypothetical protein